MASSKDIANERSKALAESRSLTMDSIKADREKTRTQLENHMFQSRMETIADSAKKQAAAAGAFSFQ